MYNATVNRVGVCSGYLNLLLRSMILYTFVSRWQTIVFKVYYNSCLVITFTRYQLQYTVAVWSCGFYSCKSISTLLYQIHTQAHYLNDSLSSSVVDLKFNSRCFDTNVTTVMDVKCLLYATNKHMLLQYSYLRLQHSCISCHCRFSSNLCSRKIMKWNLHRFYVVIFVK